MRKYTQPVWHNFKTKRCWVIHLRWLYAFLKSKFFKLHLGHWILFWICKIIGESCQMHLHCPQLRQFPCGANWWNWLHLRIIVCHWFKTQSYFPPGVTRFRNVSTREKVWPSTITASGNTFDIASSTYHTGKIGYLSVRCEPNKDNITIDDEDAPRQVVLLKFILFYYSMNNAFKILCCSHSTPQKQRGMMQTWCVVIAWLS